MNKKLRWALISGLVIWGLVVIFLLVNSNYNKNILEQSPAVAGEKGKPHFIKEIGLETKVPLAVVVSDERIYVTNSGQGRVHIYDKKTGRLVNQLGEYGEKDGQFIYPNALAITTQDELLVGEFRTGRIQVFNQKGKLLRVIDSKTVGRPLSPLAMAVNEQDLVYVANRTGEVLVMDTKGKLVANIGKPGSKEGLLAYPNGIALDGEGKIYVSDSGNDRIQVFDPQGKVIKVFPGSLLGISMPRGIAVDRGGRILITDVFAHRIAVFDDEGMYLFDVGDRGQQEGQLNFPNGLAIDQWGDIYVTDRENNRVNVYGYR